MGREKESFVTKEKATVIANGLIEDISDAGRQINFIYGLGKDQRGFATPEEKQAVRNIQKEKDQKLTDLLILRKNVGFEKRFPVELEVFPGEEIHEFSMNPARLYVPSDINPLENYFVKFELSDIRKPGIVRNSIDVYNLLGKTEHVESNPSSFMHRTIIELIRIRDMKEGLSKREESEQISAFKPVIEDLNQLSANIIVNRLFKMDARNEIPHGYDIEFSANQEHQEAIAKIFKLSSNTEKPDDIYFFKVPAQNIVNILEAKRS